MKGYRAKYDAIPVPAELETTVDRALRRGALRRFSKMAASGVAAVLALVLMVANIPPLAAGAVELPVLGPLIRIMRVGSGGSETTDVHMDIRAVESSLYLDFDAPVPPYSVVRRSHPERLVLRLHGLDRPQPQQTAEALSVHPALAQVYPMACTGSDTLGLVLEPKEGQTVTLGQYDRTLILTFVPASEERDVPGPAYRLSGGPMDFGPELAELTEKLLWEGATQLRLSDGRYQVVLGCYSTLRQAELAQQGILEHTGISMTVEKICDP